MKVKHKENILNVPNALTAIRLVLTFVILYLVIAEFSRPSIVIIFVIAAITDGLDGFFARKLNQKTEFGRRFDIFTDRIFLISIVLSLLIIFFIREPNKFIILQLFLVMSREIIEIPVALFALFKGKLNMVATFSQKLMTFMQFTVVPLLILNWKYSIILVIPTSILGFYTGINYFLDYFKAYKKP